jgi:hypothetical protein
VKHFYVEKMTQEPCEGCCEHSWSSWEDFESSDALEPWREVGRPEGLCAVKGDPIPWVVQVVGTERNLGFGVVVCGEWITRGPDLLVDS